MQGEAVEAVRRVVSRAAEGIDSRRGLLVLFSTALGVYALQSLVMPLQGGRDLDSYLQHYEQLGEGTTALPMLMLFRTAVTPVVAGGLLDLGGGILAQVVLGLAFAGWVVCWTKVAALFGRRAALATAVILLLYPAYGILFHRLSSDVIFAFAMAVWLLLLVRALSAPSLGRLALVGVGLALLILTRPGNQLLLLVVLLPLALPLPWRRRLLYAATIPAAALTLLVPYIAYNGQRYGDYTIARGGSAYFPYLRSLIIDHSVDPDNGPASRELAREVERRLLPEEPYRSYGVTLDEFFSKADMRMWEDTVNLSDQVWGWDSRYSQLREVGIEAVKADPGAYVASVMRGLGSTLWQAEFYLPSGQQEIGAEELDSSVGAGGEELPTPSKGRLIPAARMGVLSTTRDGSVGEVWTSPTAHHFVFASPAQRASYERMVAEAARLEAEVSPYSANETLVHWFNRLSRAFPRPLLWLVLGVIAVILRRPARWPIAVGMAAGAVGLTALVGLGTPEYVLPVAPAFVVLAAAGLFGRRATAPPPVEAAPGAEEPAGLEPAPV